MNQIIENLLQLQACETGTCQNSTGDVEIKKLRTRIPAHVLTHYDRLRARGKQGAAFVRHGVCGQCHMQLALGLLASLHRQGDMHCCQTCGAYLSMEEETPVEMPLRKAKPVRRARKLPTTPTVSVVSANG
jgi:predicted  nucleic acid-binding Zn-ribbon protein